MSNDPKATVKIRFTKDTEEVFALEDGRRRVVKIPRGTIRMVRPPSARYWVKGMGVAEEVRDGSARPSPIVPRPWEAPQSSLQGDLIAIRDGLVKQDTAPVYDAFKRIDATELDGIAGLTDDSTMVLQAAHDEVAKKGAIDTVAIGDLTDAVNEAIAALANPPAPSGDVPALPGVPGAPVVKRGPGRPAAAVSKSK